MSSYRSDRQIVEELLPVRLFGSVITHGIDDPNGETAMQLLSWLRTAEDEVLSGIPAKKANALLRRSWRIHDAVLAPFRKEKAAVAKFGLVIFHVLDNVRRHGRLVFVEGGPLDAAISAILAEDGTITEIANIEPVDESAQKRARKVFAQIQAEGLFPGMVWG